MLVPAQACPRGFSRTARRFGTLAAAAALAACSGGANRADAYEALADSMVINKAYPAAAETLNTATKYDSNEPRRWLKLGRVWRMLNNPALSAMAYQRALDLDPANVEALQNLAVLTVRAGRFADAKQFVEPLLVLNPNDLGGLLAQGAIAFFERRYADADATAAQMIQLNPDMSEGYVLRARVMEARGDPVAAARLLQDRLDIDTGAQEIAVQLLGFYQRAGNLQGIRKTALVLARLAPDDVSYQMEAARAHHAAGREDEARAILADLLARHPGSPGLNSAVADYWIATLPADQAAAKIMEMAGSVRGRARSVLGGKLVQIGRAAQAVALLRPDAGGPVDAGNIEVQAAYAAALFAADRFGEAQVQTDKVLVYDQNDIALLVRAKLALRKRDFDAGLMDAEIVRDNDPDNEDAALLVVKLQEGAGNPVLARKAFGDAQSAMPDNINIVRAHVAWLFAHKMPEDAALVAAQFARAHPRMGTARDFARDTCRIAQTRDCLAAANNSRKPWNL